MRVDFIDFLRLSPFASRRFLEAYMQQVLDNQNVAPVLASIRFAEHTGIPDELQSSGPNHDKVTDYRHL